MFDNPLNPRTIYRVTDPGKLTALEAAIGAPLLEACRIPGGGRVPSTIRAWTTTGVCYELPYSGPKAMQPTRAEAFDRTAKLAGVTA